MPDPLSTDDAEENVAGHREFIGKVVYSAVDTARDELQGKEEYENDIDVLYEIEPLNREDWSNVFELGVDARQSLGSKWMVFVGHLENVFGGSLSDQGITTLEDLTEFLEDKVFKFKDINFDSDEEFTFEHRVGSDGEMGETVVMSDLFGDMDNTPNPMLVPVEHVDDPETLEELEAEGEIESADEVDF